MTTPSDVAAGSSVDTRQVATQAAFPALRPLLWSLRRELWENKSLYLTPLAVAGLVLFSYLVGGHGLPTRIRGLEALDPLQQQIRLAMPFSMAASAIIVFTYVAGAFYCLDALYGERRDRSILFWKSLPVSDLTTVLAKFCVPLVVLPVVVFVTVIVTQLVMMGVGTLAVAASGLGPGRVWSRVPLFQMTLVMLYGLVVHALWHAPLYAWLLLVSAWARRLPLLWLVLPPLALGMFERMTFGTSHIRTLVRYRVMGTLAVAFDFKARAGVVPVVQPIRFLTSPDLWLGLLVAGLLLAAAARLRRYREPI